MHGMVAASASPGEQGAAPEALAQEGEHDEDDEDAREADEEEAAASS